MRTCVRLLLLALLLPAAACRKAPERAAGLPAVTGQANQPAAIDTASAVRLRFLDVGQGDAAVVRSPEGRTALIDAGPHASEAAAWLRAQGIDTIDLFVTSHNHADHIGGAATVLRTMVVRNYMDNGVPAPTATYRKTLQAVQSRGVRYLQATPRTITLGSVTLRVLPRPADTTDQNNSSVGILLTYGAFTALFSGDAETAERAFWVQRADLPPITVLKVAHHGSVNGTDAAWLRAIRPQVAVISVGADNTYGHPHAAALRALAQARVQVLRTDQAGTIAIDATKDGKYSVRTGLPPARGMALRGERPARGGRSRARTSPSGR